MSLSAKSLLALSILSAAVITAAAPQPAAGNQSRYTEPHVQEKSANPTFHDSNYIPLYRGNVPDRASSPVYNGFIPPPPPGNQKHFRRSEESDELGFFAQDEAASADSGALIWKRGDAADLAARDMYTSSSTTQRPVIKHPSLWRHGHGHKPDRHQFWSKAHGYQYRPEHKPKHVPFRHRHHRHRHGRGNHGRGHARVSPRESTLVDLD